MAEYLDKGGLEHYHSLIKQKINAKADSSALANKADKTDLNHYLDLNKTTTQTMKGALYVGGPTSNIGNAYTHQRKVTSNITGKSVNGVAFAVAQTGEASFQHKTFNDSGTGGVNDAVIRFWKNHFQFASNTGSGNVPTEDMYKEIATQEYVDSRAMIYGSAHSNTAASAQTAWTNYITVTVPENGVYRIEAVARVGLSELASNRYVRERVVVDGSSPSTLAEFNEIYMPGATDYYANSTVTDMGVATLSRGQTVALQFKVQGSYDSRIQIGTGDLFILKLA